jgi:hypothetical protein
MKSLITTAHRQRRSRRPAKAHRRWFVPRPEVLEQRLAPASLAPYAAPDIATTKPGISVTIPVLANDSDPDGDALSLQAISLAPSSGAATITGGQIVYTPAAGFIGFDSFVYLVDDGDGSSATTATALVQVRVSAESVGSLFIENFSNDFDLALLGFDSWDLDPLTVPGGDTDADANTRLGPDIFPIPHDTGPRIRLEKDTRNRYDNPTPLLYIGGGLVPDPYDIDFRAVPFEQGGLEPTAEVVSVGFRFRGKGQIVVEGDNGIKTLDVPNLGVWSGLAVVSNDPSDTGGEVGAIQRVHFTALEDQLLIDDLSVLIFDAGFSNHPPVAADDSAVVHANESVALEVLRNDADGDADVLEIASANVIPPAHGTASVEGGRIRYSPAPGYVGPDQFVYQVSDGRGGTDTGAVSILVVDPPHAQDVFQYADRGTPTPYNMALYFDDLDSDAVSLQLMDGPFVGSLTERGTEIGPDGRKYLLIEYDNPFGALLGTDRFTFRLLDDSGLTSNIATATLDVFNQTPFAQTDRHGLGAMEYSSNCNCVFPSDAPLAAYYDSRESVLENDFDLDPGDDQRLEAALVSGPVYGRLEYLLPNGHFRYVPPTGSIDPAYSFPVGRDSFTYRVTDGYHSALAQVIIDINVNFGAASFPDTYSMLQDTTLTVFQHEGVRANDRLDGDGDPIRAVLVEEPQHGTLTFSETGGFIYQPDPHFLGVDFFGYDLTDDFVAMVSPTGTPGPLPRAATTVTILVHRQEDADGDGIPSLAEDREVLEIPGHSFGNNQLAYSHRADIASIQTPLGPVTLLATAFDGSPLNGVGGFTDVEISPVPPPGTTPPEGFFFPFGFLSFRFQLPPSRIGDTLTFRLYVHSIPPEIPSSAGEDLVYMKYGSEPFPDSDIPHWYEFGENIYEEVLFHAVVYRLRYLEFQIKDGGRGDSDLEANGVIVDPGAIAVPIHPPRIQSVVINDAHAQRSMVTSITVTFDNLVAIDPGAFELRQSGMKMPLDLRVSLLEEEGRSVARLTFRGSGVQHGSLKNGTYSLTIYGDNIRDADGRLLDGNGDGDEGGDRVDAFFRLFGDTDGDGDIDSLDKAVFNSTFGKRSRDPAYLWYLDANANGRVWAEDLALFRLGYNRSARRW